MMMMTTTKEGMISSLLKEFGNRRKLTTTSNLRVHRTF